MTGNTKLLPDDCRELVEMSLMELWQVYDGLCAAIDGFYSIQNQPRVDFESRSGEFLGDQADRLDGMREALIRHVEERLILTEEDYTAVLRRIAQLQNPMRR